jgi:hypothetical protein
MTERPPTLAERIEEVLAWLDPLTGDEVSSRPYLVKEYVDKAIELLKATVEADQAQRKKKRP